MPSVLAVFPLPFGSNSTYMTQLLNDQLGVSTCSVFGGELNQDYPDPYGGSDYLYRFNSTEYADFGLDSLPATICLAFQLYLTALVPTERAIFLVYDGATLQCYVTLTQTVGSFGVVKAYRGDGTLLGTSSVAIQLYNQWHQFSIKATVAESGAVSVYQDGQLVLNLSGVDTRMSGADQMTKLRLNNSHAWMHLYDVVLSDDHFSNMIRVKQLTPNADGDDVAWTASAGERYQCVDDLSPNISDYISSLTAAQENSVKVPAVGVNGTIQAVVSICAARKSDVDARTIKQFLKSGGTKSYGSEIVLGGTLATYARLMLTNPVDASAWEAADFGASGAQFGVKMES